MKRPRRAYDALYAQPGRRRSSQRSSPCAAGAGGAGRLLAPGPQSRIAELEAQVAAAQAELDLLSKARGRDLAAAAVAVTDAEPVSAAQSKPGQYGAACALHRHGHGVERQPGRDGASRAGGLTLADLDHLQAETTDLSERDVDRRGRVRRC